MKNKKSNRERILFQEWQDSRKDFTGSQNSNESLEGKPVITFDQEYLNQ